MPGLRRAYLVLVRHPGMTSLFVTFLISFVLVPLKAEVQKNVLSLSLQQFTELALKRSQRSANAVDALNSSRYGWVATHRSLTWPQLSATASKTKSLSDDDAGTKVRTGMDQGALSLQQPLLTGTKLSVDSTWTGTKTETDALGVSTPSTTRSVPSVNASVTQPLYVFTGNDSLRNRRKANLQWDIDQDSYRSAMLGIEFDARSLYYNLLVQSETNDVQRKKFESSKLVHQITRALVRAGKLAEVELSRADIRNNSDLRQIQNTESQLEKLMNQAKDFILASPDAGLDLTSRLSYQPFQVPLEKLLAAAMENNPNLDSARCQMALAEIGVAQTREGDRPQLNANGSYNLSRNRSDVSPALDPYGWTVGLGLAWPIFDGTQTYLRTKQSELALAGAKISYATQESQLKVDVKNAYLDVKRAEDQINDFEPQRKNGEETLEAMRLQYRNGLTRLTDVFDAENQMLELELEYLNLLGAFNIARDQLKVQVGVDLNSLAQGSAR